MSMMDPLIPHTGAQQNDGVPAADLGAGGPDPAPGYGVAGEEPDVTLGEGPESSRELNELEQAVDAHREQDSPFRTPEVQ